MKCRVFDLLKVTGGRMCSIFECVVTFYKRISIFGLTGSVLMENIWVEVSNLWFSTFGNQDIKDSTVGSVPGHIVQLLLPCAYFINIFSQHAF